MSSSSIYNNKHNDNPFFKLFILFSVLALVIPGLSNPNEEANQSGKLTFLLSKKMGAEATFSRRTCLSSVDKMCITLSPLKLELINATSSESGATSLDFITSGDKFNFMNKDKFRVPFGSFGIINELRVERGTSNVTKKTETAPTSSSSPVIINGTDLEVERSNFILCNRKFFKTSFGYFPLQFEIPDPKGIWEGEEELSIVIRIGIDLNYDEKTFFTGKHDDKITSMAKEFRFVVTRDDSTPLLNKSATHSMEASREFLFARGNGPYARGVCPRPGVEEGSERKKSVKEKSKNNNDLFSLKSQVEVQEAEIVISTLFVLVLVPFFFPFASYLVFSFSQWYIRRQIVKSYQKQSTGPFY